MIEGAGGAMDNKDQQNDGIHHETTDQTGDSATVEQQKKEEFESRLFQAIQELRNNRPEYEEKVQKLYQLDTKQDPLSGEEIQERDDLTNSLTEAAQSDPFLQNYLNLYVEGTTGRKIEDQKIDDTGPQAADIQDPDKDITPVESADFQEQLSTLQAEAKDLAANPPDDPAQAEKKFVDLRRQIGDIGDSAIGKKIRNSKHPLTKFAYGLWMGALTTFAVVLLTTKLLSRVAGGGGRK